MIKRYLGVSIIAASMLAMGCSSSDDDADPAPIVPPVATFTPPADATGTVLQTIPAELVTALGNAGITELATGNYTIFAPSAAALAAAEEVDGLLDPALPEADRQAVLQYHIANGVHASAPGETGATQLAAGDLEMLSGAIAAIAGDAAAGFTFGGAAVTATDAYGTDGVVHEIDAVVAPPAVVVPPVVVPPTPGGVACVQTAPVAGTQFAAVASNATLTSFLGWLQDSNLGQFCNNMNDAGNGPWTVFAPSNTALAAYTGTATTDTVKNHIHTNGSLVDAAALVALSATEVGLTNSNNAVLPVTDNPLTVNGFTVTDSIVTDNGTIHIIEGVIP